MSIRVYERDRWMWTSLFLNKKERVVWEKSENRIQHTGIPTELLMFKTQGTDIYPMLNEILK